MNPAGEFEVFDPPELIHIFKENPDLIRLYLKDVNSYDQLCLEVTYVLRRILSKIGVEFSTISYRVKSLESFSEKLFRKNYKNPLKEITDIGGVRLVYLYKKDFSKIEKIINSQFEVVEKVDKNEEHGEDKFGYNAIHYVVRLSKKSSGARYDDLKNYCCEIQVRTILQDAWAIIDHHLIYKRKEDVPLELRRKLNSLSGLFETADDQFEQARSERNAYLRKIKHKEGKKSEFLEQEINIDTLRAYLQMRFQRLPIERSPEHSLSVIGRLERRKYKKLADIEDVLKRTENARKEFTKALGLEKPGIVQLVIAMVFDDVKSTGEIKSWRISPKSLALIKKFVNLVEAKRDGKAGKV